MHSQPDSGQWGQCEAGALRIEYSRGVMEQVRAAAVDGFMAARHGGVEVGGVLFGQWDGDSVRITGQLPLPCEHALGPGFKLSEKDEAALAALLAEAAQAGLQAVGWYHSHTRTGLEMGTEDLQIHRRYFPEPWQVALLVRPYRLDDTRACFFVPQPGSGGLLVACGEFAVTPYIGPPPEPLPLPTGLPGAEAELVAAPEPGPAAVPAPAAKGRLRRRWVWLFAAATLLQAGGWMAWTHFSGKVTPLGLKLSEKRGWLLISWDTQSSAVKQAQGAIMEISDGARQTRLELSPLQLREGSVWYSRESERVEVRLRLSRRWRAPLEESALFLGEAPPTPAPSQESGAVEQALRERDELIAEIERLRGELRSQRARNAELEQAIRLLRQRLEIEAARGR